MYPYKQLNLYQKAAKVYPKRGRLYEKTKWRWDI